MPNTFRMSTRSGFAGLVLSNQMSVGFIAPVGDYESIATVSVGSGGVADITFSSIPATFKHLQVRYIARNTGSSTNTLIKFNGDTGSNYTYHYLLGNGTSASSAGAGSTSITYVDIATSSATSVIATVIDILDYANTNKNKTVRSLSGIDLNGSGTIWLASGVWRNTAAITSLQLKFESASNFAQYSHFALYGIKG